METCENIVLVRKHARNNSNEFRGDVNDKDDAMQCEGVLWNSRQKESCVDGGWTKTITAVVQKCPCKELCGPDDATSDVPKVLGGKSADSRCFNPSHIVHMHK